MSLRSLLQDRMAALNGRTVEYVLKQDLAAFVRLIGLSVAQARAPDLSLHFSVEACQEVSIIPWLSPTCTSLLFAVLQQPLACLRCPGSGSTPILYL